MNFSMHLFIYLAKKEISKSETIISTKEIKVTKLEQKILLIICANISDNI